MSLASPPSRLHHPGFVWGARLILVVVLVAAALPKLWDPPAFAQAIHAYQLAPRTLVAPLALGLPWLELLLALGLLLGPFRRIAALWVLGLMLAFTLGLGINLYRGNPVDCGCFGASQPKSRDARLVDMRWAILRDLGLALLALGLLRSPR